jgi:hypothetical protein
VQRFQQEPALLRVTGTDQPRDHREGVLGLSIGPFLVALSRRGEADEPAGVAVAAADVALARVREHRLHAGAEELEVERGLLRGDVLAGRQGLNPLQQRLVLGGAR